MILLKSNIKIKNPFILINNLIKPIPNFPGYFISPFGDVFSNKIYNFNPNGELKRKKTQAGKYGHLKVKIYKNGNGTMELVHRLVLEAFVGACPDGLECCHNDGNSGRNYISNLRWDTHLNNMRDSVKHGTSKHTEETKQNLSIALKGRIFTEEHKKNMRENHKGFSGKSHSVESKKRISDFMKKNPNSGQFKKSNA